MQACAGRVPLQLFPTAYRRFMLVLHFHQNCKAPPPHLWRVIYFLILFPFQNYQDGARSFEVNLRISVAETAEPLCSTLLVVAISVLPLLIISMVSPSATSFSTAFAGSAMCALVLSLAHGMLLVPALLLVCGEKRVIRRNVSLLPPGLMRSNRKLFTRFYDA